MGSDPFGDDLREPLPRPAVIDHPEETLANHKADKITKFITIRLASHRETVDGVEVLSPFEEEPAVVYHSPGNPEC